MKKVYLYLFIFAVMINVFTYMYFTKKAQHENKQNQKKELKATEKQAIIDSLEVQMFRMSHYTLAGNYSAQDYVDRYFENHNIEKIRDSILNLNHVRGGNTLVGYDAPEDPYVISRAEFLNHRWILADFDNSRMGGQLLIRYYLESDGTFSFETIDRAVYLPKPITEDN